MEATLVEFAVLLVLAPVPAEAAAVAAFSAEDALDALKRLERIEAWLLLTLPIVIMTPIETAGIKAIGRDSKDLSRNLAYDLRGLILQPVLLGTGKLRVGGRRAMLNSISVKQNFAAAGRRRILKSGLLMAFGAGLTPASIASAEDGGLPTAPTASRKKDDSPQLSKGMVAFMLAHEQFPASELIRLGVSAESAGFDLVATSDHFQPWQANERHVGQAWVTLGALGQRTQRIWMGPTVTCPTLRYNPAVVAEAFATLSLLYPGRIFLGLGSGEALNEQAATGEWPVWRERWDRLIEAVTIIRELWTGQPLQHKGTHYTVDGKLYDPPAQPIPLLLAANGPKAMKLAGEHGDGLITDPQTWKQHKEEWEEGARSAGKNPWTMPVLVEAFVVVGDRSEAQGAAKLWNFIPKAFKGYQNIPDPAQIEHRAQTELPLPKVFGDWTVSSDPDAHAQTITKLFDSGVTIVNIHSGQPDQQKVIDFYGREVLPRVRNQTAA